MRNGCLDEADFRRERMVMHACLSQVKPQPVPATASMRLWHGNGQRYRLMPETIMSRRGGCPHGIWRSLLVRHESRVIRITALLNGFDR